MCYTQFKVPSPDRFRGIWLAVGHVISNNHIYECYIYLANGHDIGELLETFVVYFQLRYKAFCMEKYMYMWLITSEQSSCAPGMTYGQ